MAYLVLRYKPAIPAIIDVPPDGMELVIRFGKKNGRRCVTVVFMRDLLEPQWQQRLDDRQARIDAALDFCRFVTAHFPAKVSGSQMPMKSRFTFEIGLPPTGSSSLNFYAFIFMAKQSDEAVLYSILIKGGAAILPDDSEPRLPGTDGLGRRSATANFAGRSPTKGSRHSRFQS